MINELDCPTIGLSDAELKQLIFRELEKYSFEGKRILVIVPDNTRTIPLQLFFSSFQSTLLKRVKKLDFLIALGTHPAMTSEQIHEHFGVTPSQAKASGINIFNHQWDEPRQLKLIGTLAEEKVKKITGGLLAEPIPVNINKKIFEYDQLIILGPVFPHEVVGFSGRLQA
jgi:nickel-dependent lactate racemase